MFENFCFIPVFFQLLLYYIGRLTIYLRLLHDFQYIFKNNHDEYFEKPIKNFKNIRHLNSAPLRAAVQ